MISPKLPENETRFQRQNRKVWVTSRARLEAARRLGRLGRASHWVIMISSLVLVAMSIALLFRETSLMGSDREFASIVTVVGAVAILVVSAIENAKSYNVISDRHHRSGMALNELMDRMNAGAGDNVELYSDQYHQIIKAFPDNHEPIDYRMFAVQHPKDFTWSWYDPLIVRVLWHMSANLPWMILLAVSALFFVVTKP